MLKSVITAIIIFALWGNQFKAFGQTKTQALQYYKLIDDAEMQLCHKHPTRALNFYTKAFLVNPDRPFSSDLYNAFHAAMDCRDYRSAKKWLSKLIARGLSPEFIKSRVTSPYKGSDHSEVTKMLEELHSNTDAQNVLKNKLEALRRIDQGMRQDERYFNDSLYLDSVLVQDQDVAAQLYRLIVSYGKMPNQVDIGHDDFYPFSWPNYTIIMFHHSRSYINNREYSLFDTLAYKAIFTWDFSS